MDNSSFSLSPRIRNITSKISSSLKNFSLHNDLKGSMEENFGTIYIYIVCIILVLIPVTYYLIAATSQQSSNCKYSNEYLGSLNTNISPVPATFNFPLRDYYIKSAYNCCCSGNYKNDFVDLCILTNIIKQGVRWLDVEVFSIDDNPVIAASTTDSYYEKQMYNSIAFNDFLNTINSNAFNSEYCPNYTDPLFIHIRFKTNNPKMYDNLTNIVANSPASSYYLPDQYNYNYQVVNGSTTDPSFVYHRFLGEVPLNELNKKIIFVVSVTNSYFMNTPFYEYVNMTTDSNFCNLLSEANVQFHQDIDDLIIWNMKKMTFLYPNITANPKNPNCQAAREFGIQCCGMVYSKDSTYLLNNESFFDSAGYAFVLKPLNLRYVPVVYESPTPLPASNSFAARSVSFPLGVSGEI